MAVQAWILMTEAEKNAATLLDSAEVRLGALPIENALANNLGLGALVGRWVSPARLLNDPEYAPWVATLGTLPIHVMDSDTLFAPPSGE